MMDDGLATYGGLMARQPCYQGTHYLVTPTGFMVPAPPVQQPHPPMRVPSAARVGARVSHRSSGQHGGQGWIPQVVDGDRCGRPVAEELSSLTDQIGRIPEDAGLSLEPFFVC
jgi:hypothetical protein